MTSFGFNKKVSSLEKDLKACDAHFLNLNNLIIIKDLIRQNGYMINNALKYICSNTIHFSLMYFLLI